MTKVRLSAVTSKSRTCTVPVQFWKVAAPSVFTNLPSPHLEAAGERAGAEKGRGPFLVGASHDVPVREGWPVVSSQHGQHVALGGEGHEPVGLLAERMLHVAAFGRRLDADQAVRPHQPRRKLFVGPPHERNSISSSLTPSGSVQYTESIRGEFSSTWYNTRVCGYTCPP